MATVPTRFAPEPFTFEEASAFIAGKKDKTTTLTSREYLAQWDEQTRRKSFFSARVASADLLAELHQRVQQVVDGKMTDAQARELLRVFLAGDGRDMLASLGFAPPSVDGGLKELGSVRRLQLIIDQNTKMAQEVGAYRQWIENADIAPYGRWHLGVSEVHRKQHVAHDGKVYRYDHPIWTTDPPGGLFNCHCWREEMTQAEVDAEGLSIQPGNSPVTPSPLGFDPSKSIDQLPPPRPGWPPEIADEVRKALQVADGLGVTAARTVTAVIPPTEVATTPAAIIPPATSTASPAAARTAMKKTAKLADLDVLNKEIDRIPDAVLKKIGTFPTIKTSSAGISRATKNGTILEMINDPKIGTVFHHEFAHHIHYSLKVAGAGIETDKTLLAAMKADYDAWIKAKTDKKVLHKWTPAQWQQRADNHAMRLGIAKDYKSSTPEEQTRISAYIDTIGALSKGKHGAGHSVEYYQKGWDREVFAHIYNSTINGWPEFITDFPLTSQVVKAMVGL
jgi:hypothetical protein